MFDKNVGLLVSAEKEMQNKVWMKRVRSISQRWILSGR